MSVVARLVTLVDLRDEGLEGQMSFSARQEAVLVDDRRVLLLDDRGWTSSLVRAIAEPDSPQDVPDFWDVTSAWAYLAGILRHQGVAADADELKGLPHDVVLSERVLALLGRDPETPAPTTP
jgi:hypothetical protein